MNNPVQNIIRASTRTIGEPLNILTFPTHERYETMLCKTGHNFYAFRANGIKNWNESYAKLPPNYVILDESLGDLQVPNYVDFDLVLSQNKFGQFQIASQLAKKMHLPMISLEHTLPVPNWSQEVKEQTRLMRGDINLFISEYSIGEWKWDVGEDTDVITHGVDTDLFKPLDCDKDNHSLSVVNDWINRDWCCGFSIWQRVIEGLPHRVIGDTKGLSKPSSSIEELVSAYQTSRIFLNTSTISPIPTALLEAMSCSCAVVSTATCMIPEIIEHGVDGFITNDEKEMREYLELLSSDEELALEMGKKARQKIVNHYSKEQFVNQWLDIFYEASKVTFRG